MNDSLLLWVFNVFLQVTCISALGLITAFVVRKHAAAKYWVLGSALLLMLLSPLIVALVQSLGRGLISFEVHTITRSNEVANAEPLAPALSQSQVSYSKRDETGGWRAPVEAMRDATGVGAADATVAEDIELRRALFESAGPRIDDSDLILVPQRRVDGAAPASMDPPRSARDFELSPAWRRGAGIVVGVWLAGTIFLLGRLGVTYWRLRRVISRAAQITNPTIAKLFASVAWDLQPKRIPELELSGEVSGPISAGWRRPRIVLPMRLVEQITTSQLRDILVHEMAHVVRRDPLKVLVQKVAVAVYWFHPLARWLNRMLAQAREEVCDNYVLATTSAQSYSLTLLALAELVTPQRSVGGVGLFTSRWKLEYRVVGLLDERRSRAVELGSRTKLQFAAMSLLIATAAAFGTVTLAGAQASGTPAQPERAAPDKTTANLTPLAKQTTLRDGPTLRGEGKNREMLLSGRVLDIDNRPARGFELAATLYSSHLGRVVLPARVEGNDFEVWVPIGGSHWFRAQVTATSDDGNRRAVKGIGHHELRKTALDGVDLRLTPTRPVEIAVTHDGAPVANAHVNAQLSKSLLPSSKTDKNGKAILRLGEGEKLEQLTAWTDDFRIGGYSFIRKPHRDPTGDEFTIELDDCRDQTIRFLDVDDNSPVPHIAFELVIGTGTPNFNFAAVPATFPRCRMTTDKKGEATFRWFPDWETHGAYVEIIDPRWATAVPHGNWKTGDDGSLVMTLKRRVLRRPFVGKVTSDRFDVGGLLVEIKSFQGEEALRPDYVYAFTDDAGSFTADIIPGATYTVCVNDGHLLSHMIDLVPHDLDTGNANIAVLDVSEGNPVEIRVTSGPGREPMRNQCVYLRQLHHYNWLEGGEKRGGQAARDYHVFTGADGLAHARALAGAEVQVSVYAGEWRSELQHVTVRQDGITLVEIHREVDTQREVRGRLLAPPNVDVELAGAEIIFGSIDGEVDEREVITADAEGRFAFTTKAFQLGIFAATTDGKAAGVAKPKNLEHPIEIPLKPTMDLHGQLLGEHDEPLASYAVRVSPRVSGERDVNKSFATAFQTRTFEAKTDANGNYTLNKLPAELEMTLRAASIDCPEFDAHLDNFFLIVGDKRPRMVSRLGRSRTPDDRPLSEKHDGVVRDARLGGYHVLVLVYVAAAADFVNTKVLDRGATQDVMSFLNLRIDEASLANDADRRFAEMMDWPRPTPGKVFVCALDEAGMELGRIVLDGGRANAAARAAAFIRKHAPPQADARAKWDAAFADAKHSGRRVWAHIDQRYSAPCFRLSRWLDDNRALLERDYVLLKVDDVRDKHGVEIASRIVNNREQYGVPFHAILDASEQVLVDSDSSVGDIDHLSSFEGRHHLTKMLRETSNNLTHTQIKLIIRNLEDDK